MSKTTVEIDLLDLSQCLARLASLKLYMEHHDMPAIGIDRAVWRMTEANGEVEAMWKEAQKQARTHHGTTAKAMAELRSEYEGRAIINDQPAI